MPLCSNDQLSASLAAGGGYAGHLVTEVVLRNRGQTPCDLFGYAALRPLVGAHRGSTAVQRALTDFNGAPLVGELLGGSPTAPLVRLGPGDRASFRVVSSDFRLGRRGEGSAPYPPYRSWLVSVQTAGAPLPERHGVMLHVRLRADGGAHESASWLRPLSA